LSSRVGYLFGKRNSNTTSRTLEGSGRQMVAVGSSVGSSDEKDPAYASRFLRCIRNMTPSEDLMEISPVSTAGAASTVNGVGINNSEERDEKGFETVLFYLQSGCKFKSLEEASRPSI